MTWVPTGLGKLGNDKINIFSAGNLIFRGNSGKTLGLSFPGMAQADFGV